MREEVEVREEAEEGGAAHNTLRRAEVGRGDVKVNGDVKGGGGGGEREKRGEEGR